jgi:CAAX protease family protein
MKYSSAGRAGDFVARRIWIYLVLTFAISWLLWLPVIHWKENPTFLNLGGGPALVAIFLVRSKEGGSGATRLKYFLTLVPILWAVIVASTSWSGGISGPLRWDGWLLIPSLISAWIISGAWSRDKGVRDLMTTLVRPPNWRWPVVALLAFPVLLLGSAVIGARLHMPLVAPAQGTPWAMLALLAAVRLVHNLAFTATYEEPGWRGFLLPELEKRFSPLVASVFVWLPWALWHAPLDFFGGIGSNLAVWIQVRIVYFFAITILLTWLYNRSRSLLTVTVFHAAFNVFPFLLPYSPPLLSIIFVWAAWVVVSNRMWRCETRTPSGPARDARTQAQVAND